MEADTYKVATQTVILGHNPRITLLGTTIDVLSLHDTISLVEEYVEKKIPLHLMGINADKIYEINRNARLKYIVNSCGVINADGASVVMASRFLGIPLPERVAGIDLMQRLVDISEKKGYSIYLLGAKEDIVTKTAEILIKRHPKIKIAGIHNGYFEERNWQEISNEIKAKSPNFIFVGITSPLKEYLVKYMQNDGNNGVFMGVGGSFDVISGKIPRAPIWMQKSGFEWLFRVMQEPKRLFKRYFIGNAIFVKAIVKEKFISRNIYENTK